MAGFKTHITTSSVLGVGYTGLGLYLGLPIESSLIAGGMCGIGGMLPDIDSDSGVPFRESMGFAAAIVPVLLLSRLSDLGLNFEQMVLVCGGMYLFVRFGIARLLARYTVHRGMFHSIPAALTFAGVAFLLSDYGDLQLRYFKTAGLFVGVMSHLLLDELYAVEWKGGRWRFKKSFGTAMKLWGKSAWANISTYGKLTIVVLMILGEPMVMDRYGHHYEDLSGVVIQRDQWRRSSEQATEQNYQPDITQPQLAEADTRRSRPPTTPTLPHLLGSPIGPCLKVSTTRLLPDAIAQSTTPLAGSDNSGTAIQTEMSSHSRHSGKQVWPIGMALRPSQEST